MGAALYEFDDFRLDPVNHQLSRRNGTPVPLTPRVFDTLLFMVEHPGLVLDKERLMEAVWSDSIVEENNLAQTISKLRQVLGEKPGTHQFIVTVPGRGYRFAANVTLRNGIAEDTKELPVTPSAPLPQTAAPAIDVSLAPAVAPPPRFTRRAVIAMLALVALIAGVSFLRGNRERPALPVSAFPLPLKSIAVMPFESLSSDTENSYFADGVQDEILTDLAKLADLKVISRLSMLSYKDKTARNLPQIAQQLGVAHLLEGSVQRVGGRVRVNVQLIATATGSHEWAETYDRDLADVFAIQSEIAQSIAIQLHTKISPDEKAAITQAPTTDLVANALYQKALALWSTESGASAFEAIQAAGQAVARDRQFLRAYCLLARLHLGIFHGGYDHTSARLELAHAAIQNAIRIQPAAGEVHLALARYAYYGFRDYDRARAELDVARRTLPNDAEIYFVSAALDRRQGRWIEASRNADRAVELDPRNANYLLLASGMDHGLRRNAEARRLIELACSVEPRNVDARLSRGEEVYAERADPRPLKSEISAILADNLSNAEGISEDLLRCALAERDPATAARAVAAMPTEGVGQGSFVYPREWFAGLVARTFNDSDAARSSFNAARAKVAKQLLAQPDYAQALSLLGQIDAALGRKEEALREGRRACELAPLSKDAVEGAIFLTDLAVTYTWVGEKDLALEQLNVSAKTPMGVNYGRLVLEPQWDALRDDPRFQRLVASLAPQEAN